MIATASLGMRFSGRKLFEDVNLKFTPGNCYGVIGANGAGKSTFVKILSGELEATEGEVIFDKNKRMSVLKQDHFQYEEEEVLNVVLMGNKKLWDIMVEKNAIYAKTDFTDEDGIRAAELEGEFAELNGWDAETEAETLLMGLKIGADLHHKLMKELTEPEKVKVLLAQALFGEPDVLLLDEPTNGLDVKAISWLENFIMGLENSTVIVVSHDRHFLNKVCTHITDIDYGKIKMYVGNYDFWYESKQLEKLQLEDMQMSNRKYPFVEFKPEREAGNNLLKVENLSKTIDGVKVLDNVSFTIETGDKVVFLAKNDLVKTTLLSILAGEIEPDSGTYTWGVTTSQAYMPRDNSQYFNNTDVNLIDWLRPYSPDEHEAFIRGFLGRMLFSGDETLKKVSVLSGGEKVRCMLSKLMLSGANVLLFDNPSDHLDKGTILFGAHDHEFIQTVANRIIEITPKGLVDKVTTYDEYLEDETIQARLDEMYS